MNYNTFIETTHEREAECVPESIASMTDLMKKTSAIAHEVKIISHRINSHLFGIGAPCNEQELDPKCFRDELTKTHSEILETMEELHQICAMLGV